MLLNYNIMRHRKTRKKRKTKKKKNYKRRRRKRRRKKKTRTKRGGGMYKGISDGNRIKLSPDGIRRVLAGNYPVWSTYRHPTLAPYLHNPASWRGRVQYARKGCWGLYFAGKIWVQWIFQRPGGGLQIVGVQYADLWQGSQPPATDLLGGPVCDIERINNCRDALQPG